MSKSLHQFPILFMIVQLSLLAPLVGPFGHAEAAPSRLAAGGSHVLAVKTDGSVWAWGLNDVGQLGDGSTTNRSLPVPVPGVSGVTAVAAGTSHSLAILADGSVKSWGKNLNGQLGTGTQTNSNTPLDVSGLGSGVVSVAAGSTHSLAVKSDGTVYSWGANDKGQLGNGTTSTTATLVPTLIANLSNVVAVAAGTTFSLALKDDGTVWGWGLNDKGQLGDTSTTNRSAPVQVSGLTNITTISAGLGHGLALKDDGTVWAWGGNANSQLGDGLVANRTAPYQVAGLSQIAAVAAGSLHSLAATTSGEVWSWGDNASGQLGDGSQAGRSVPVTLTGISGVTMLVAGSAVSVALKGDNSLWTWGKNDLGQLGTGALINLSLPVLVPNLSQVTTVSGGQSHTLALTADGKVYSWGRNDKGQLGDGTTNNRYLPAEINGLNNVIQLSAGSNFSAVLKDDGTVWCWGGNDKGQLGDGTLVGKNTPAQVPGLNDVVEIGAGWTMVVIRKRDNTIWYWGGNNNNGGIPAVSSPQQVAGLPAITSIAVGANHALALSEQGEVWGWGNNTRGELVVASSAVATPVRVSSLTDVKAIAAGSNHSMALLQDGSVWSWGWNIYGQVGNGMAKDDYLVINPLDTLYIAAPYHIAALSNVKLINAGGFHSMAVKDDGSLWEWGYNSKGQIGNGATGFSASTYVKTPAQVEIDQPSIYVDAGNLFSFSILPSATLYSWGENFYGQLGVDPGWNPAPATINLNQFNVTVNIVNFGTATPTSPQSVVSGGTTAFTLTPAAGSVLASASGCGGTLSGNVFTTGAVTSDCTVTVTFSDTAAPLVTPSRPAGSYYGAQNITLTANETANIYYTIDGSDPTPASPAYSGAIPVTADLTIKYRALDPSGNDSGVQNLSYVIKPLPGGDADGSGGVTSADALLVLRRAVGLATFSAADLDLCDVAPLVNGVPQPDGAFTAADALVLLRRAVGLISW